MKLSHIKVFAVAMLVLSVSIASAFFTGNTTSKSSKFSLKNLNKLKAYSYASLRNYTNLKTTATLKFQRSGNTVTTTSLATFQHGNTTFVMPYQAKIKFTKFVTPKAPSIR